MTLDEFDALKPGDKVSNAQGHVADVATCGDYGVRVQWGGIGPYFTIYRSGRLWTQMDVVMQEPTSEET